MTETKPDTSNHFDAAKVIVETLKPLDREGQILALKFASETLGLHGNSTAAQVSVVQGQVVTDTASPAPVISGAPQLDIRSFTEQKKPKSDQQFAALVAYYYKFEAPMERRRESIDAEVLLEAARLANRKRPTNPGMTLTNAKNSGFLDSVGKGAYTINSVGENLVAVTLPGNGNENEYVQRKSRAKTKKADVRAKSAKKRTR